MLLLFIFIYFLPINNCFESSIMLETDYYLLSRNLIDNLRVDPILIGELPGQEISQTAKEFIDKHVERYRQLMLTSRQQQFSRSKRSLGVGVNEIESRDYITDFRYYGNISASAVRDIVFFHQNSKWYAASINKTPKGKYVLQVSKYQNGKLYAIKEETIENGVQLGVFTTENFTIIVVAENSTNYTKIYELNSKEELRIIQRVNGSYCKNVAIWEDNGNVFMSLVGFMANSPVSSSALLYKWRGRHFDVLQDLDNAGGVTGITPFRIDDEGYLGVARNGEEIVYSEILKYNVETNKYELFQKILTYVCKDIKYFEIDAEVSTDRDKEKFLIVANFYQKDFASKTNYQSLSIIYKFIDNYFLPLQTISLKGVRQWETITNQKGDVLLIALTLDGLKAFQYNGWRFVESEIRFKQKFEKSNTHTINVLHSYYIDNKNILVVPNENDSKNNSLLFEVEFSTKNQLQETYNQLLTWCQDTLKLTTEIDEDILKEARRGDIDAELESDSQIEATDLSQLTSNLNIHNSKLSQISEKLENSLQSDKPHSIERSLEADHIHINSTVYFDNILTTKINDVDSNLIINNVINLNEGFEIDSEVEIEFLRTGEDLEVKNVNGHSGDLIIYKNVDASLKNVLITESAIFNNDLEIGRINDLKINANNLLLKRGDQNLEKLRVSGAEVLNKVVNGQPIQSNRTVNVKKGKVKSVKAVKMKNLRVSGFLNDVDVPTLEKYALRKSGKQDITAETYYIDRVESELLDTDRLSGHKIPEDFVLITKGAYDIPVTLMFKNPITVKNLTAFQHLNSIPVRADGTLDLLKDVPVEQYVTGLKTLENLEILNRVDLRGKLEGKAFDEINPMKKINGDLNITKDVIINGNVRVEDVLKSANVISKRLNISQDSQKEHKNDLESLGRIMKYGIKLVDENVNVAVEFLEHLNVKEINTDAINGIKPNNWVITGAKYPQVITGWKTFEKDLEITGNTKVLLINNIDTEEFEQNILKIDSDQNITGKHEVKTVIILEKLLTNNTKFGAERWKNVITTKENQTIANLTLSKLEANYTPVENIKIDGLINGINFTRMVKDAVLKDKSSKIFGTKYFKHLNVRNLSLKEDIIDVKEKTQDLENSNIVVENFPNVKNITVQNIYFTNNFNGLEKSKFGTGGPTVPNGRIKIEGDHEFEEIEVYGNVYLDSNQINGIDLSDVEKNSVKIDEPLSIPNVVFTNLYVLNSISHKGQIEHLDLNNIFENNREGKEGQILDKIDFGGGISVKGTVNINGLLNGVKFADLCGITSNFAANKKLIIEGNVHFVKGPRISKFNGFDQKEFNDIWFTDRPVNLLGKIEFQSNITMRENVNVQGLLNGINIDYLSTNYLSKTKDQNVSANFNFSNATIFLKDINTPQMFVKGRINDIYFEEFLRKVLLHRPQLFEDTLYFEEITVEDLEGNYLVNKLNLDSEVMRYDRPNLITGPKSFGSLDVDVLSPTREGATVQDVDVSQWMAGAVLDEGHYKIEGKKKFINVEVNETTNLMGHFNDIEMNNENVLLRNIRQEVTGIITFAPLYPDQVKLKAVKIKGKFNGEYFSNVISNQAKRNQDNIFKSSLSLDNNIWAENINLQKFNDVNVTELLNNISNVGSLQHITEKYHSLINMADQVEKSVTNQAYFLDYYKPILPSVTFSDIFSISCGSSENKIISFQNNNGTSTMEFLEWDVNQETFDTCCLKDLGLYPNYIKKINVDGMDVIYIEHFNESTTEDNTHTGVLMSCKNTTTEMFGKFLTKGTSYLTSFRISSQNLQCLLFIDFSFDINILCSGPDKEFKLHQTIINRTSLMASVQMIENLPYLITIHKEFETESVLSKLDHISRNNEKTIIWKLNQTNQFEIHQIYYDFNPISVSTISSPKGIFLAVACKHSPDTQDFGRIIIRRFDKLSQSFHKMQTIKLRSPTQIAFSQLPSKEIALYVITENPSEAFIAYLYEGVSRFVKKIGSTSLSKAKEIKCINMNNQHFVIVKHDENISVLQGVFKGNRFT